MPHPAAHYHRSRLAMGLSHPGLLYGREVDGFAVVPPGATCPEGMVGLVAAAFELADQIREGLLPEPQRVVVALGTGGTAVGLAVGLGLAGIRATVHAVATVERVLTPDRAIRRRLDALVRHLVALGIAEVRDRPPVPLFVDRSQLGPGYGIATAQSLAACEILGGAEHDQVTDERVAAAAEALIDRGPAGPAPIAVAANVDRFLATAPQAMHRDIHAMMNLIEHGTTALALRLSRFTALDRPSRVAFLDGLSARGWLFAQAARGLRDLVMMGYWQDPSTWEALDYPGPWGPDPRWDPETMVDYEALRAPQGRPPWGVAG